jgi:hypothetical protein
MLTDVINAGFSKHLQHTTTVYKVVFNLESAVTIQSEILKRRLKTTNKLGIIQPHL